ncbi:MAG: phosphatidylglycerol lysyltransferase [Treponema sp.]|nr:phosphatidylglycerol lysyltransferase [Treponema sp.]
MISKDDINTALDKMILSASGWRGIFAENGDEESGESGIVSIYQIISSIAAFVFAEYLSQGIHNKPIILLGSDTRPTGKTIIDAMIPVLLACGCDVRYAGITAAPEIMAWARLFNSDSSAGSGFIYISASHNPIGHNGFKFGLTDGGVLPVEEANKLIANFRTCMKDNDLIIKVESLISGVNHQQIDEVYANIDINKTEALKAYYNFCEEVIWDGSSSITDTLKENLAEKPLGIVCDFNGSARTVSIDKDYFSALGLKFKCINDKPGQIKHRIVPEGESLEPCAGLLEEVHARDSSFVLGYVPDCDGDRGNLVIWDDSIKKARSLEAQEVFALACVAELSQLIWADKFIPGANNSKAAIAINDPTSKRIDNIAEAFGISVFRAEVGEANVVTLARKLREEGYIVRILGEGSAGGNITHPSAVRDPVNTVLAIVKMLLVRSTNTFSAAGKSGFGKPSFSKLSFYKPGLFEIWCDYSGQKDKYRVDFSLSDIIASLPPYITTAAYNEDAILRIKSSDHTKLKDNYQKVFLREWEELKDELKTRFGFISWEAIAYNGTEEKRGINRFGEAGRGGLKILFFDKEKKAAAYIWMRGSATEPVFRLMADVKGTDTAIERFLLDWQRQMIIEADRID